MPPATNTRIALRPLAGIGSEAVEQLLEDSRALLAGGGGVGGAGDIQRALVKGANQYVGQGATGCGAMAPASIAAWSPCWSRPRP